MPQRIRIFYHRNAEPGWAPVTHLAALASRLLQAESVDLAGAGLGWSVRLRATLLAPPSGGKGGDIFLLRSPAELAEVFAHPAFRERRAWRALWIIDSFWTEMLLRPVRHMLSRFDLVACTRAGDLPEYRALCGERAVFLGWGADVLELGGSGAERPWDVLRIGRQPEEWDDDARTAAACAARGLSFHGRPPFPAQPEGRQQDLMRNWYGRAKFVIAHSNLAAPAGYTHPAKEYLTARWTDAIACGATVAGCQPHSDLGLLDWPEAVLETGPIGLEDNLDRIAAAVAAWTPERARRNHAGALKRLDWRWRIAGLAERLDCGGPVLAAEMARLRAALAAVDGAPPPEDCGKRSGKTAPG
ncbi:hypothetical protein [Pseudogemmobacter humi]|uniref:Glycosyl transferases group 1 n=1 Tax=Pseudogemmobacter humi TaxID=2483812 RepID=A0A3P5X8N1_9RHOB|nr:hypothetical protein [Pseudogemmobacter humi]VDC30834.1 hypothetical protein XINFAN_02733 [Pseudogemmobacter humi]